MTEWILSSSLLILAMILLRRLLGGRVAGWVRYALWGVVLLRLLVPVQLFPAPVSVGDLVPQHSTSTPAKTEVSYIQNHLPTADAGDMVIENGSVVSDPAPVQPTPSGTGETTTRVPSRQYTLRQMVGVLWAVGTVGALLVVLWSNLRFSGELRRRRKLLEGTAEKVPVYVAEGIPSPCLFGLLRPAIYVTPAVAADPQALRHVLAHETTHYRHGDHIWSALRALALAVHWFNPLVWWAVVLSKQDGELACDEGAIRQLGEEERQAYGETLLGLLTAKPGPRDVLACATTMTGGKRGIKERLTRIIRRPRTLIPVLLVLVLAVGCAVVFTFGKSASAPVWQEVTVMEGIPYGRMDSTEEWTALSEETIAPPAQWQEPDYDLAGRGEAETIIGENLTWGRMVSAKDGWLVVSCDSGMTVDTYVYRTGDGGKHWTETTQPGATWYPSAVGFLSRERLIVATGLFNGAPVYMTRDGGNSWEELALPEEAANLAVTRIEVSGQQVDLYLKTYASGSWRMVSQDLGDTWELNKTYQQLSQGDWPLQLDLDHDGALETVTRTSSSDSEVLTVEKDGAVLWSDTGSSDSAGWNTIVLLNLDSQPYLMRYRADLYTVIADSGERVGAGTYSFRIFHLNERGEEVVFDEFSTNFDLNFGSADHHLVLYEMQSFLETANGYLKESQVLLNTNSDLQTNDQGALQEVLPWMDEEGFTRDDSKSLYDNLVAYVIYKEGKGDKTALDVISSLTAADITYISYNTYEGTMTAETLAAALNRASGRAVDGASISAGFTESVYPIWSLTLYLEGGPDSWSSEDRHLDLGAGLTENLVEITYSDSPYYDKVVVEDSDLYWMLRRSSDREEVVDQGALTPAFQTILNSHMEETLENFRSYDTEEPGAGYSGYELTRFEHLTTNYDAVPGTRIEVYIFDYALTMERPEHMFWVGGNYMDSQLRMRGFDNICYFAAYYQGGELVHTHFFAYDLFWAGEDVEEQTANTNSRLAQALEDPEVN